MKKIININLASRLIPIEDSAYELLKTYLDNLKRHFGKEEGGEEIVSDIEDRIAEVFQDKLKKGAHCITDEDVNMMVNVMGRPEQLEEETATEPREKQTFATPPPPAAPVSKRLMRDENDKILGGVCSGIATYFGIDPVIVRIITFLLIWAWGTGLIIYIILWIVLPSSRSLKNPVRKRLYRNPDNKVIGGVASGIAAYANIDPVIPRILFILPLLGVIFTSIFQSWHWLPGFFFPLSIGSLPTLWVLYIILWISVPKAQTVTEKLEMRGEKIDLQSITNAMKGSQDEKKNEPGTTVVPDPAEKAGSEDLKKNSIRPVTPSLYTPPVKHHTGLGELLVLLVKIFAYFILAIVVIAVCGILIGIAGGFIGVATTSSLILPYKGLILNGSLQHFLSWPAIILTVGIPVVAIIWFLIKLITGFRPKNRYVGATLFCLWIVGIICAVWLCISIGRDFRMNFKKYTYITTQQPTGGKLLLSMTPSDVSISGWNVLNRVILIGDDTVILKTIHLDIRKSKDDSFHVELIRASNGHSVREARMFAENIHLNITQQDSVLYIPDGFSIPRGTPFRNQHIAIRVFIPEGKQIRIDDNLQRLKHFRNRHNRWEWSDDRDMDHYRSDNWDYNENYKMTPEGLKSEEEHPHEDTLPAAPVPPAAPDRPDKPYRYKQTAVNENLSPGEMVFNDAGVSSPFL